MQRYVFDTNTLVENPELLNYYRSKNIQIIIPMVVLEEIDGLKNRRSMLAFNARQLVRKLEELGQEIQYPVSTRSGKIDNIVLDIAESSNATLLTFDKVLKIKAISKGVSVEEPKLDLSSKDTLYSGVAELDFSREDIDSFYDVGKILIDKDWKLNQNQYVLLKGPTKQSAIGKVVGDNIVKLSTNFNDYKLYGIKPRNIEQLISIDALTDPNIKIVSLVGKAGSGKTLCAIAAGIRQIFGQKGSPKKYRKIIITRPIQTVGKDIGYLPGTHDEKMQKWIGPIHDNLETLMENGAPRFDDIFEKEKIKVEAMAYVRGRSFSKCFIIVDEAQNMSPHEVKTILTRVGEGTKIVLTGDIEQIDNPKVNKYSNGLTYMIEKLKHYSISAHVSLVKGERSEVADLAAKVL